MMIMKNNMIIFISCLMVPILFILLNTLRPRTNLVYNLKRKIELNTNLRFSPIRMQTPDNATMAKKWVVITSIFAPTKCIKILSRMEGWQVLVVGDKKTPADWSWSNVVYLGPEAQEELGYRLLDYLSWNAFTRKNIGYLYAIQHGAEVIYETDDDNVPIGKLSLFTSEVPYRLVLNTNQSSFNPHVHFGQSSTWPRGYPLDHIGLPVLSSYTLCLTLDAPVVQSLVNGDPDIDAIYRLTRRFPSERIDVKFDEKMPLFIYPSDTYTPYNCQNTLFRRAAFWSMLLPISVSDRATDIFRAYWAERLMALIGQKLAFGPASFFQNRSPHSLLKDFDKEIRVYLDSTGFIDLMRGWKCFSEIFSDCILQLTRAIIDAGYYKEEEYALVEAWLDDLKSIDPSLVDFPIIQQVETCIGPYRREVILFPNQQLTTMPHDYRMSLPTFISNNEALVENFKFLCNNNYSNYLISLETQIKPLSQFVLVLKLQSQIEDNIIFFLTYYKLSFDHILFCSESKPSQSFLDKWKSSIVIFDKDKLTTISCISAATKLAYNATGYFYMEDPMMLNVQTTVASDQKNSEVWLPKNVYMKEKDCRAPYCFTFKRANFTMVKKALLSKINSKFESTKLKLIEIVKILEKEKQVSFLTNHPSYLPTSQALFLYHIESLLEDQVRNNDPLLHILFYSLANSYNYLKYSDYSEEPTADFHTHSKCGNLNPKCICQLLN